MKTSNQWRLLPHEIFFGLFLLITWIRLVFNVGFFDGDTRLFFALIAINIWLVWFCRSGATSRHWRWGLLFYPVVMNVVFMDMKTAIPKIHPEHMDALLQRLDQLVIGKNLSLQIQPLAHPAFTEVFSFCYILFFPYLLFSLIYYFCGDVELLKRFVTGLFTVYGIGFLGYSFVPAVGPGHAMADQFLAPLNAWWITRWNASVVARGSNGVDVFPSLHCSVSSFFLFFDRRHRPWRFKLYLVPCIGLWISTIYLRYHYFVDICCGFMLSAFALWIARNYPKADQTKAIVREAPESVIARVNQNIP